MDPTSEQAALLALLRPLKSGWGLIADAVEESGSALAILAERGGLIQGDLFAPDPAAEVSQRLESARAAIELWAADDLQLTTILDDDYPDQLRTIHQRPPFLFYSGVLSSKDARGVAVVGTRKPTGQGLERASEIASGLALRGVSVISGLAAGIDAAAHRAALGSGGRTVGVIGTGLRQAYPKENAALQAQLATEHLVLSQFWPDSAPTRFSFPMRNAVMSGFAAATVVVEAAFRSGAKMQARLALEHGRPVFLLDSLLVHEWAREYSKRPGTTVVKGPEDVLAALDDALAEVDELVLA